MDSCDDLMLKTMENWRVSIIARMSAITNYLTNAFIKLNKMQPSYMDDRHEVRKYVFDVLQQYIAMDEKLERITTDFGLDATLNSEDLSSADLNASLTTGSPTVAQNSTNRVPIVIQKSESPVSYVTCNSSIKDAVIVPPANDAVPAPLDDSTLRELERQSPLVTPTENQTNKPFATHSLSSVSSSQLSTPSSLVQPLISSTPTSDLMQSTEHSYDQQPFLTMEPDYVIKDGVINVNDICTVTHVVSPSEFYVQVDHFEDAKTLIEEFERKPITGRYQGLVYKSKEHARSLLGDYCFLLGTRAQRVQVLDWCMSTEDRPSKIPESNGSINFANTVVILLIDSGRIKRRSYKLLHPLPKYIAEINKLAVRCSLYGIKSNETSDSHNQWSTQCTLKMIELCGYKSRPKRRFVTIYAGKCVTPGDLVYYNIDLLPEYVTDLREECTLAETLVRMNLAVDVYPESSVPRTQQDNAIKKPTCSEANTIDIDDVIRLEQMNLHEAVFGYQGHDYENLCPVRRPNGTCYKGSACALKHTEPFDADGLTCDKVVTYYKAANDLPEPSTGETLYAMITGYVNPCHFYVQFPLNAKGDLNPAFVKLYELMNHPEEVKNYQYMKICQATGELVLVYYSDSWRRATYYNASDLDPWVHEVFLVDYGLRVYISEDNIRQIPDEFVELGWQAFECRLYGYQLSDQYDEKKAREFFEQNIIYDTLAACIEANDTPLKMSLWRVNDGQSLGHILTNFKFVEPITPFFVAPNGTIQERND